MTTSRFHARPLRHSDAQAFAGTATAIGRHSGTNSRFSAEDTLVSWQEPDFDLESASLGVFADDGQLAGYAVLWANATTPVRPWLEWGVHPDHQRGNLSPALFLWAEEKARDVIERCPSEARVAIQAGSPSNFTFKIRAMEDAGFKPVRAAYDMRIAMTERPQAPDLPAGFSYRSYRHEEDLPQLVETVLASFSDHFGYIEQPFEKELAEFRHWLHNSPHYDPALVLLVIHEPSGVIAGCLVALSEAPNHPGIGFIDAVGVRREFRRRGLAKAMLYRSFASFWDRGTRTVELDVDGESLTNAVALYEKVGMRIHRKLMSYEKVLREGVELATVALE